jgi:hypothetical protein
VRSLVYSSIKAMFSGMSWMRWAGLSVGYDHILLYGVIKTAIELFQRHDFNTYSQGLLQV